MRAIPVLLLATLACQPIFAATANVEFEKPESFTDAGRLYPEANRLESLPLLRDHIVEQAARRLPADETLSVWITDVDLAGQHSYGSGIRTARIVKQIYPPRIELRFRLARADGSIVKEGTRSLRDDDFLTRGGAVDRQDSVRYENAMLDRWIETEFRR